MDRIKNSGVSMANYGYNCISVYNCTGTRTGQSLTLFRLSAFMTFSGNGTPGVYKLLGGARTRREDYDSRMKNDIKDDENPGDLYIGHSGDPWGASSARNYEDIYVRASSSANTTANNTRAQPTA